MNRKNFIKSLASLALATKLTELKSLNRILDTQGETSKMPVLFMGHGNPMNAIEENAYTRGWRKMVQEIPTPSSILIISAHWETSGTSKVYAGSKPKMIYDMYGFPKELYEVKYPAMGKPDLANKISTRIPEIKQTEEWGLDHGAWSVLVKMYPEATIPCFQLSLNKTRDMQWHYDLGKQLAFLRKRGVLILCSGNINHNLGEIRSVNQPAPDWALEFDNKFTEIVRNRNHKLLINYNELGNYARMSVNSGEHFIPVLYALALQEKDEEITYTNHNIENTIFGAMMRCIRVG